MLDKILTHLGLQAQAGAEQILAAPEEDCTKRLLAASHAGNRAAA